MIILAVQRGKGRWIDKGRRYRILVDGVKIGRLAEGETIIHDVEDGSHVIEAKMDWCGGPPLHFEARSENVVVTVKNVLQGWEVPFAWYYSILRRHEYLKLDIEERKPA